MPPENEMWWIGFLRLEQYASMVGAAIYVRTGHRVYWEQNPSGGYPGTQVFRYDYSCVNGLHNHVAEIYVSPPWPFVYTGPQPIEADQNSAIVAGCVQGGTN